MNSRQILACIGAAVVMLGLLVLVSRRHIPRIDPNDSFLVEPQTVTLTGGNHGSSDAGLSDLESLSKQAGREATNLFKLPTRPPVTDTNTQLLAPKGAEENTLQQMGDGFLPGPPPGR